MRRVAWISGKRYLPSNYGAGGIAKDRPVVHNGGQPDQELPHE